MPVSVHAAALLGVDALPVTVEVDLLRRLPQVVIVGLASASVRESADRVRSAMLSAGFEFPRQRVVVSLAPADLRKEGTGFDLPIAVAVLAAAGRVDAEKASRYLLVGELSLSGELRPVRGALAFATLARDLGLEGLVVPSACAPEAALVRGIRVYAAPDLAAVAAFLDGAGELSQGVPVAASGLSPSPDLGDVRGQYLARRAVEVAAAGGHNLLFEGSPGCGKTMLACRLPSILPTLSVEEALECTRIQSVAGLHAPDAGCVRERPFRAPHASVSVAGLVGGASLRPGEVSLAHNGVLFLDEFPEFPRNVREVLRGPLEDRRVVLARAAGQVVLPARFMLVAAANPCPCGFWGHPTRPCICPVDTRERYRARLSGPLVDRIDLRVELSPVTPAELLGQVQGESSATVRERVEAARARQSSRYGGKVSCNAELRSEDVIEATQMSSAVVSLLRDHMERTACSARVARRLLKVARTIADLDARAHVEPEHLYEAFALRCELEDAGARLSDRSAPACAVRS